MACTGFSYSRNCWRIIVFTINIMQEYFIGLTIAIVDAVTRIITAFINRDYRRRVRIEKQENKRSGKAVSVTEVLKDISAKLGTDPGWLSRLIEFESGWNPQAKNPRSSARGLLQFTDATARNLGYADSQDLVNQNPTIIDQLKGPVYNYLKMYAPLDSDSKLFMAVFYPRGMNWSLDREFPDYVQKNNPGIVTVRDYIRKVYRQPDPWGITIAVIAIAGVFIYSLFQN